MKNTFFVVFLHLIILEVRFQVNGYGCRRRILAFFLCLSIAFTAVFQPIKSKALLPAVPVGPVIIPILIKAYETVKLPAMIYGFLRGVEQAGNTFESIFGTSVYEFWKENFADKESYDSFVDGLPDGLTATSNGITAYGTGFSYVTSFDDEDLVESYWSNFNLYAAAQAAPHGAFMPTSYNPSKVMDGFEIVYNSIFDCLMLKAASHRNADFSPYDYSNMPLQMFLNLDCVTPVTTTTTASTSNSNFFFLNYSDAYRAFMSGKATGTLYYLIPDSYFVPSIRLSVASTSDSKFIGNIYNFGSIDVSTGVSTTVSKTNYINTLSTSKGSKELILWPLIPFQVDVSDNHLANERLSALTAALIEWNQQNTLQADSTVVNYYISPVDSDQTFFQPGLYDEENLVYSDPVTETQYLTNGWTYDYLTRCYTLDMADDAYLIGDTVIDTIKLTYGDELLTVDHYASGSLIRSDEYNYVMVSGSQCGLDGHTNVITDTQDSTCTADGHRTYTCSVCGNQTVETIPKTDHAYGDFTVEQEASCTAPGIHSFSCSTCGGQYTDIIPALGHDWQPTSSTEESYVMPDNVSCPECHGTDFTWTRQDLELKTGKNLFDVSQFVVGPASASNTWVSEVGADYFVISEPDSYTGNGLLSSGKPLSSFAPRLEAGVTYTLSFVSDSSIKVIRLNGSKRQWRSGSSIVLTQADLDAGFYFYGFDVSSGNSAGHCRVGNIQIEAGTLVTDYEPYDPEYVEIVPPLYHFICSNPECGAAWSTEAEYQGATITYTCTRCDATRTEAAGEEAGLFHSIGNLIADGIAWVTDKLAELIDGLTVMMGNFNRYLDSVKTSGGQFPAFLAAIFGLFPEDFMNVIWFGLIGFVVLLVWKKWFS